MDYDEITALGTEGGYAGLSVLANNSAALILSVCNLLRREWFWFTDTYPFDADDYDEICALIAQLESDIMTSAVGAVMPWAASVAPPWGLMCDGTVYLKADYPELWDALGSDWEESGTEFKVPNLVDRFPVGASSGGFPIGELGGENDHVITEDEMPEHVHEFNFPFAGWVLEGDGSPWTVMRNTWVWRDTQSAGSDVPMPLLSKYQALYYVIVSGRYTDHAP